MRRIKSLRNIRIKPNEIENKSKTNKQQVSARVRKGKGRGRGYNFTFLSLVGCTAADCIAFQLCVCFAALQFLEQLLKNWIGIDWRVNCGGLHNVWTATVLGTATVTAWEQWLTVTQYVTGESQSECAWACFHCQNTANAKRNWNYVSAGNRNWQLPSLRSRWQLRLRHEASQSHADSSATLADSCSKRVNVNQAQFQFAVRNSQFTVNERVVATFPPPSTLHLAAVRLKCNMKLKLWVRCCRKLAAFCWWNFRVNASSALLFWHYSAWKLGTTTTKAANNKGKQQQRPQCTSRNADSPNEQRTTLRIHDARCASAAMPSGAERLSKRAFLVMGRTSCPCGLRFSNALPLSDTLWMKWGEWVGYAGDVVLRGLYVVHVEWMNTFNNLKI